MIKVYKYLFRFEKKNKITLLCWLLICCCPWRLEILYRTNRIQWHDFWDYPTRRMIKVQFKLIVLLRLLFFSFSKQLSLIQQQKKYFIGLLIRFLPLVGSFQVKTSIKLLYCLDNLFLNFLPLFDFPSLILSLLASHIL